MRERTTHEFLSNGFGSGHSLSGGKLFDSQGNVVFDQALQDSNRVKWLGQLVKEFQINRLSSRAIMRQRLHHDVSKGHGAKLPEPLRDQVASLYTQTASLINKVAEKLNNYPQDIIVIGRPMTRTERQLDGLHVNVIGHMTEAAIASLLYRSMEGTENDQYTYIPSSYSADNLGADAHGIYQSYDGTVIVRETSETAGDFTRIQIKTKENGVGSDRVYDPEIALVALSTIHGSFTCSSNCLQKELGKEAQGKAADTDCIDSAEQRLHLKIKNHIDDRTVIAQNASLQIT